MKSLYKLDPVKGLLLLFIATISSCVPKSNHGLDFCLYNTSNENVIFVLPNKICGYCMGGLIAEHDYFKEVSFLDTTITAGNGLHCLENVSAKAIKNTYSVYEFDELFQYDTLRVFVVKEREGGEPYDYDYDSEERFIVRYDISYNDTSYLLNKDGALVLYYPPDERMKNVKMWPRYDDIIRIVE